MKRPKLSMPTQRRASTRATLPPPPAATPAYASSPAMAGMMSPGKTAMPPKLSSLRNMGRLLKRRT